LNVGVKGWNVDEQILLSKESDGTWKIASIGLFVQGKLWMDVGTQKSGRKEGDTGVLIGTFQGTEWGDYLHITIVWGGRE